MKFKALKIQNIYWLPQKSSTNQQLLIIFHGIASEMLNLGPWAGAGPSHKSTMENPSGMKGRAVNRKLSQLCTSQPFLLYKKILWTWNLLGKQEPFFRGWPDLSHTPTWEGRTWSVYRWLKVLCPESPQTSQLCVGSQRKLDKCASLRGWSL